MGLMHLMLSSAGLGYGMSGSEHFSIFIELPELFQGHVTWICNGASKTWLAGKKAILTHSVHSRHCCGKG